MNGEISVEQIKTLEKKRLRGTLSSICCMLIGAYIAVFAFGFIFAVFFKYLSYFGDTFGAVSDIFYKIQDIALYIIQLLVPALFFILIRKKSFVSCVKPCQNKKSGSMGFGTALAFGVCAFAFACSMSVISSFFTMFLGLDSSVYDTVPPGTPIEFAIEFIAIAILPPILEEFVFRGVILSELLPYGKAFAIVGSAVFFASVHGSIEQMMYSFVYGLIFAFIAVKSSSLLMPVTIHFLNNAYSLTSDYLEVILSPESYALVSGISYTALIVVGLICAVYLIGKNKTEITENGEDTDGSSVLSVGESFSTFASPLMVLYFIYVFLETVSVYFLSL